MMENILRKLIVVVLLSACFCVASEATQMYILHMKGAEDHVVYVNGFKHFSQEGDEDNLPDVMTVLVEGVNTVVIISGGNVSGKIEKFVPLGERSIICDWDLDENAPAEVTLTFELVDFEYEWSWINAEQIAEITPADHAEISQKVNEVISAFEDGENDLDSVLQTHLKYDMIDAALAVGVTEVSCFSWNWTKPLDRLTYNQEGGIYHGEAATDVYG